MNKIVFILLLIGVTLNFVLSQEYTNWNIQFAGEVYKELTQRLSGNFIFSPFLLQSILLLALMGADGKTAEELSLVSNLPNDGILLQTIHNYLKINSTFTEYHLLNTKEGVFHGAVYPNFNYSAKTGLLENKKHQLPDLNNIPAKLNNWVHNQTGSYIKPIKQDTGLFLTNTLHLKEELKNVMQEERWSAFESPALDSYDIKYHITLLQTKDYFNYLQDQNLNCKFVEIPFVSSDIVLIMAYPIGTDKVSELEKSIFQVLTVNITESIFINLSFPMHFHRESMIDFKPILQSLGLHLAFTDQANFDKLSRNSLKIQDIMQTIFFNADSEEVTSASASINEFRRRVKREFHTKQPFLYFLKHKVLGILYLGRYNEP